MMDTGFSGFLLLPLLDAFPIGLILQGTMSITLADGSNQTKLTWLGTIHFDGRMQTGLVIIEWRSTEVLVGMDFLRKFGLKLEVDEPNGLVELLDSVPTPIPVVAAEPPVLVQPPGPPPQPVDPNPQNSN
jgi:predicted aspartyl protease